MQRAAARHYVVPHLAVRLVAGMLLLVAPAVVVGVALELASDPPIPCLNPYTCPDLVFPRPSVELFSTVALGVAASFAWLLSAIAVVRIGWPRNATWLRSLVAVALGLGAEAAVLTTLLLLQLGNGRRNAVMAAGIVGASWALVFMTAALAGRAFRVRQGRDGPTAPGLRAAVVLVSALVATPIVVLLAVSLFTPVA